MLLAPQGAGSLERLGKLYKQDGDYNKRVVFEEDKR
jgi:hypothetical protein